MNLPRRGLISRRNMVAGAALTAVGPGLARAQNASARVPRPFRTLQIKPASLRLGGPERDATALHGFNGLVPGPVLRVRRGEELRLRLANELTEPTTVHWHGVRVPNPLDGVPGLTQAAIAPGASFDCTFAPPDAGTFWYRAMPRRHGPGRGLHGLLIVDEAEPVDVDRDIALVLDAWWLGADGTVAPRESGAPLLSVNGLPSLDIPVRTQERIRLRLLNAADNRIMTVRFEQHQATVMAIDGQPAEYFPARDGRISLAPGNRADVFIDATLAAGATAAIMVEVADTEKLLARLVYEAGAPVTPAPRAGIAPLPANPLPARMDFRGAQRAELALDGKSSDMPLLSVKRGRTVMLALANKSPLPHAVHIHGHSVRLLDKLDDGWKPFWLDTILVLPQQTARIAFVADNPGKWLIDALPLEGQGPRTVALFEVS